MIKQAEYKARRQQLLQQMEAHSIAIICTKPEYPRTRDSVFTFRPEGNFYYLTGFSEPETIAVLIPGRTEGEFILFNRPRDPAKEIWDGFRAGQEGAITDYGADEAFPIDELDTIMPSLLQDKTVVYYQYGYENGIDEDIVAWEQELRSQIRSGVLAPEKFINITSVINEMRVIKSPAEIETLRIAAKINTEAHRRAMQYCAVGLTERQLYSEMAYVHLQHGCLTVAYDPIVATGNNACILHYRAGQVDLRDGDLVLCDVGEEYDWYASDITRTYPVNGKFSAAQRAVYEAVLATQLAVISIVKPGISFDSLQELAIHLLTEKLVELGLLHGSIEHLISTKAYHDFYMHRVSHWMGLDVHDVSAYKVAGKWRKLEVGMVLTVEPGLYISPTNMNVDAKWRGIGIRIEDDVVVTATGCDVLTAAVPKTIVEIEALMAS